MALDEDIAFLARQPLLGLMERDALRLLAFSAETRMLRAGDVLFRRGEGSDCAFLVVAGAFAIDQADDGSPTKTVAGPGVLIGEMALFSALERPNTAIAREPSQVMKLSRSVMRRVLGESPNSAQAIAGAIEERLRTFSSEIATVGLALRAIDWSRGE